MAVTMVVGCGHCCNGLVTESHLNYSALQGTVKASASSTCSNHHCLQFNVISTHATTVLFMVYCPSLAQITCKALYVCAPTRFPGQGGGGGREGQGEGEGQGGQGEAGGGAGRAGGSSPPPPPPENPR